jgi:hypothetical protein
VREVARFRGSRNIPMKFVLESWEPCAWCEICDNRDYRDYQVRIEFDWQIPVRVDSPIIFQVRISRRDQHSAIELGKFAGADLERLPRFSGSSGL